MNILVTGAKGQVGCELQYLAAQYPQFQFTFVDIDDLDITNQDAVNQFFDKQSFNYCINCAAYTAVDKAESNAAIAEAVNVTGPKYLAEACLKHKAKLIQISTDYVYHNKQNTPFKETDTTNPQSVYAVTKLAGDTVVQEMLSTSIVIRTSWVYSSFGHNFVKTMMRLGKEREELRVIFDQIGTPTYARDLADAILTIIDKVEKELISTAALSGIYHYSNEGVTSWYDFAKAIFEESKINIKLLPINTEGYPTPAERPSYSVMDKSKIKETFKIEIPYWKDSLRKCLEKI